LKQLADPMRSTLRGLEFRILISTSR